MSNTYNVSVTYSVVTDESAEHGDAAERGYEHEREDFDVDELQRLVRDFGISEACNRLGLTVRVSHCRSASLMIVHRHVLCGSARDTHSKRSTESDFRYQSSYRCHAG